MVGWRWTLSDWRTRILAAWHCLRGDYVLHRMQVGCHDLMPFPGRVFAFDPPRKGNPHEHRTGRDPGGPRGPRVRPAQTRLTLHDN
jgi:hypothetical protein